MLNVVMPAISRYLSYLIPLTLPTSLLSPLFSSLLVSSPLFSSLLFSSLLSHFIAANPKWPMRRQKCQVTSSVVIFVSTCYLWKEYQDVLQGTPPSIPIWEEGGGRREEGGGRREGVSEGVRGREEGGGR